MASWWVVVALAACGRVGFGVSSGSADAAFDGEHDGAPPAMISHVAVFVARGSGTPNDSFPIQAQAAGNAIVLQVACAGTNIPTAVSVTAPGWTWTQLGPITASVTTKERAATFVAIAPDANQALLSVSWTGSTCNSSVNDLGDEFAMTDPSGGAITFDASMQTQGTGTCTGQITTGHAADVVWGACDSSNSVTGVGTGYTKSADDQNGDWAEYKVTTDPEGTLETVSFANGNNGYVLSMVALKPM